ncbi:MAG: putative lipid II flippase FtsW [Bdellovibrionales bacterium]
MFLLLMDRNFDKSLLVAVLFLIGLGLVQVYSSSYMYAIETYDDGLFFFRKQLFFAVATMGVLFWTMRLPWVWAQRMAMIFWVLALLGVAATFVPSVAIRAGGAHRWIQLPFGQRFEPAELLRVTYPFLMAWALTNHKRRFGIWEWPLRTLLLGTPMLLMLQQPDFGSFAICASVAMMLVFINGLRWRYVALGVGSLAVSAYFLIINVPYRMARIQAFIDPWADPTEKGFQVIQSMLSFYSGGLSGVGLGHGQGKLFFLPEAHTDFTLAVLGEEAGYGGFVLVLLIYGFLVFRGLQIAMRAENDRDRLIATGITMTLALSVFVNVGVVTGMLPTKGLTLPFLSYGGSSLLCTGLACGWLLSLERHLQRASLRGRRDARAEVKTREAKRW